MTSTNYQVRRSTIDDLAALRQLWRQYGLIQDGLEKRLKEFQVVETADGQILGAIGVAIEQQHGHIHSEVYVAPELASEVRPRLWERIQSLARNQGLSQLWVENQAAMFWLEQGFEAAGTEMLKKMPSAFEATKGRQWLTCKLREQTHSAALLEQELVLFRQFQQAEAERTARHVRLLRALAALVVILLMGVLAGVGWYLIRHNRSGFGR